MAVWISEHRVTPQAPHEAARLRMPSQWTPTCLKSICLPNSYRGVIPPLSVQNELPICPHLSVLTRCLRSSGKWSKGAFVLPGNCRKFSAALPDVTGWTGRLAFPPDTTKPRDNARLTASASPLPRHIGSAPGRRTSLGLSKATSATGRKRSLPCLKTSCRRVLHRELQQPRVGAGNAMCSNLSSTATSRR